MSLLSLGLRLNGAILYGGSKMLRKLRTRYYDFDEACFVFVGFVLIFFIIGVAL